MADNPNTDDYNRDRTARAPNAAGGVYGSNQGGSADYPGFASTNNNAGYQAGGNQNAGGYQNSSYPNMGYQNQNQGGYGQNPGFGGGAPYGNQGYGADQSWQNQPQGNPYGYQQFDHVMVRNGAPRDHMDINCPNCGYHGGSQIQTQPGSAATGCCIFLFLIGLWPCAPIPCCLAECLDVVHMCPSCHMPLGKNRACFD
mmetsp:Transcript_56261/g.64220  ORF Transcript_56261/g.64220 Transcript_56261/m.64220 type:complete len:199 (-) Transcript_56261:224-820(-)